MAQHIVDSEQAENLAAKTTLLERAERDPADVTDVGTAKAILRGFLSKLSEIGHVPRVAIRDLDSRVRKLFDWIDKLEVERWRRTGPEACKRAEDTAALFQSRADELTKDLDTAEAIGDAHRAKNARKSLETYTSWLNQVRQTLQDFQSMWTDTARFLCPGYGARGTGVRVSPFAPGYMLEIDLGDEFPWKSADALTNLIGSYEFRTRGDQGGSPRRGR